MTIFADWYINSRPSPSSYNDCYSRERLETNLGNTGWAYGGCGVGHFVGPSGSISGVTCGRGHMEIWVNYSAGGAYSRVWNGYSPCSYA